MLSLSTTQRKSLLKYNCKDKWSIVSAGQSHLRLKTVILFIPIMSAYVSCSTHVWCSGLVQTVTQPECSLKWDYVRCGKSHCTISTLMWILRSFVVWLSFFFLARSFLTYWCGILRYKWYSLYSSHTGDLQGFHSKAAAPILSCPPYYLHRITPTNFMCSFTSINLLFGPCLRLVLGGSNLSILLLMYLLSLLCNCPNHVWPLWQIK